MTSISTLSYCHSGSAYILYQQKVGSVVYSGLMTRVDMANSARKLSAFMSNPSSAHMRHVDHLITYLDTTLHNDALPLGPRPSFPPIFFAASDAAFADNADRTSSFGYVFMLFGAPILIRRPVANAR